MELVLQAVKSIFGDDQISEAEFISRGDRKAFARFYERNKLPLLSFLMTLISQQEIAEELTHEAFLRLFRHREKINPEQGVKSWIYAVARNLAYDYLKKKKDVSFFIDDDAENPWDEVADQSETIEMQMIHQNDASQLRQSIEQLPFFQREAMALWLEDLSYDEMAALTGKSAQAMKNMVHRARQALFEKLNELPNETRRM